MNKKRLVLLILDGWGVRSEEAGNAISLAHTPNYENLWHRYPHAILDASGEKVGLPKGQMGTSEVNHMTIGAGRVIFQDLVRINQSIKDQSFFNNPAIIEAFKHVKKNQSTLHIKGLISPGGVHSHQSHVFALLKGAKMYKVKKVYIHVFTDGRDTLPKSAKKYVRQLEEYIKDIGVGQIASISGRYYAMDRDHNWDRTDKTFEVLTQGNGKKYPSAQKAVDDAYKNGVNDEFIKPALVEVGEGEEGTISSNDAVIFANFRNDRPRQLTQRFLEKGPKNLKYVTMSRYHPDFQVSVAFPPVKIANTLGEVLSKKGLTQLRVTETEKFAHLTFFLNGKREQAFEGEDRQMLDSYSDIPTHDLKPEMRAPDITREIIQAVESQSHQVIMANICNADMVGHTGNLKPAIKAVETVDKSLQKILKTCQKESVSLIVTSDHGNAEEMQTQDGNKLTSHTTNPVPFILVDPDFNKLKSEEGSLVNVAPTVLKILGIKKPKQMTGASLV